MASTKKKRISKKNKASWRKTDIKDVEEFLEEKRQEERIGSFTETADADLFQVDVVPKKRTLVSEKKKRKANALKPLKSWAALTNTSKVQDPIVKRNHVKSKRSGRNIEQEILNPKSQRHIQANKDRSKFYDKLDKKLSQNKVEREFSKDIWLTEDVRERAPGLKNDWISKDLSLYVLRNIGKSAIKVHDSIRHKTTKAKAFEAPHPGMSYNPSLNAHKDLIDNVVNKEENIIKVEKHLKRVTTEMFSKVTPEERDALRVKEMSSGLPVEDGGEESEENDNAEDDVPYKTINPPVENKKKSKQKKRKQKEKRVMSNEVKKKKEQKQLRVDMHRIKKITSEVTEEEEELNQLKKHRKTVAQKKKFETKRLGRLKFKEPDVDVNMPEDIAGNLRNVKVETSLLVDRFKNFQKRNILPTSVEVGKRKPRKIKRFTRSSHKEPGVSISKNNKKI